MQELADQLAAHQCPKHGSPICFVYKGIVLKDESRMMCDECINPRNASQLINIKKAFRLLEAQQIQESNQIYQQKASIWQRFKQSYVQILELLNGLQLEIIDRINSIKEDEVIMRISDQFLNQLTSQQQLISLGQLLCNLIDQDNDGQYKLKQVQSNNDSRLIKCYEILERQTQVISELSGDTGLQQTTYIQQTQQIQVKHEEVYVDNFYQYYETTQTIQTQNYIFWLCFNHNQTQLIAASGQFIQIFKLSLQGEWDQGEFSPVGHGDQIWKVQFNHNSTLIASCSKDKMIFIWNKRLDGKWCIQDKLSSHKDVVYSICFNHDSTLLASGSQDKTIIIHELQNGKWIIQQVLTEQADYVFDVCFNHHTTVLASASNIIMIWQLNNYKKWIVKQKLYGQTTFGVNSIQFNSASTELISANIDCTINIWSVDRNGFWISKQTLSEHQDRVTSAQMNQQCNMIISSSNDKTIKIWQLNNENKWECTQTMLQHNEKVYCSIISSDTLMVISGSGDDTIQIHKRIQKQCLNKSIVR